MNLTVFLFYHGDIVAVFSNFKTISLLGINEDHLVMLGFPQ